jgi:hypothetical protein
VYGQLPHILSKDMTTPEEQCPNQSLIQQDKTRTRQIFPALWISMMSLAHNYSYSALTKLKVQKDKIHNSQNEN